MADIRLPELVHYDGPGGLPWDPALKAAWEKHHKAARRKALKAHLWRSTKFFLVAGGVLGFFLAMASIPTPGAHLAGWRGVLELAVVAYPVLAVAAWFYGKPED